MAWYFSNRRRKDVVQHFSWYAGCSKGLLSPWTAKSVPSTSSCKKKFVNGPTLVAPLAQAVSESEILSVQSFEVLTKDMACFLLQCIGFIPLPVNSGWIVVMKLNKHAMSGRSYESQKT